jgi:hypothetical protein
MLYKFLPVPNLEDIQRDILNLLDHHNYYGMQDLDSRVLINLESVNKFLDLYKLDTKALKHVGCFFAPPIWKSSIHSDWPDFKLALNVPILTNNAYCETVFYETIIHEFESALTSNSRKYYVFEPDSVREIDRINYVDRAVLMNVGTPHNVINSSDTGTRISLSMRFTDHKELFDLWSA